MVALGLTFIEDLGAGSRLAEALVLTYYLAYMGEPINRETSLLVKCLLLKHLQGLWHCLTSENK